MFARNLRLAQGALAALVLILTGSVTACAVPSAPVPLACRDDVDCPPDAHCQQSTCTADRPPLAVIAGPRSATTGAALTFDGSGSTDGDDEIVGYTWSIRVLSGSCAPDLGPSGTDSFHPVFGCAGDYEVLLVVRDRTGLVSAPAIVPVTITAP